MTVSPLRAPTVGGLAGGVGATTVARALHAHEIGPVGAGGRMPDVVVCRATVSGVSLAERPGPAGRTTPVLAITAEVADTDDAVRDRIAEVAEGWAGPVLLPHVAHWTLDRDPYAEAAELLGRTEPPDSLRRYAEALARIVALLTSGGRLEREPDPEAGVLRQVRGIRVGPPPRAAAPWSGVAAGPAW